MKRSENRAAAVQVVLKTDKMFWVTKPVVLRNVPVTAARPTPRLAAWRYTFAESASAWRGATGYDTLKYDSRSKKHKAGDMVLKVQAVAQETLKKKYKEVEGKLPAPSATFKEGRYRTYEAYRRHTIEELKALAGIK
jgi:hypothetical protein